MAAVVPKPQTEKGQSMSFPLARSAAGVALLAALTAGCSTAVTAHSSAPKPTATAHSTTPPARPATTPPARPVTTPPAPPVTTPPANPIPQGNGGDQDGDNNGGPSDGDGNI
jgi:hypothetical protein